MLSPVVHSVSQVAIYLKDKLESDPLLSRLAVQGEIANLRTTVSSGHSYFSLRENGSSIRCVMFRGRSGKEYLEEGQEIEALGNFTFYPPSGEANMHVTAVLPVGAGALALELARLRQQLEAEGLFDPSRKRPLPLFPRVIGVVTLAQRRSVAGHSKRGAATVSIGGTAVVTVSGPGRPGRRTDCQSHRKPER